MAKENTYLWKRSADDFLQCWSKDSSEAFLQSQPDSSFFTEIKNSKIIYKPESLLYDPLAIRGILNSGIVKVGKLHYQERIGADFCQLGYVTKGSVYLKSSLGDNRITAGMLFCTPVKSHYVLHTEEGWEGAWFHLKNNAFLSNRLKHGCLFKTSEYLSQIYFAAARYLGELRKENRSYELLDVYAELIEICIRRDIAKTENKTFMTLIAEIKRNPAIFSSAGAAAEELGISRYDLDKRCIKYMGIGFAKFLLSARMDMARKYLFKKYTLDNIAKAVGFADAFTFSKAFKTYHKCTPMNFREVDM